MLLLNRSTFAKTSSFWERGPVQSVEAEQEDEAFSFSKERTFHVIPTGLSHDDELSLGVTILDGRSNLSQLSSEWQIAVERIAQSP
jgi:hypothetical protein